MTREEITSEAWGDYLHDFDAALMSKLEECDELTDLAREYFRHGLSVDSLASVITESVRESIIANRQRGA